MSAGSAAPVSAPSPAEAHTVVAELVARAIGGGGAGETAAQTLVGWQDAADKEVRKLVRKALHTLKAKGVKLPAPEARQWADSSLASLRGPLEPAAIVDARAIPGGLRVALIEPDDEAGGTLYMGLLGPDDRVLDFAAYYQTDGQRARSIKEWDSQMQGRRVPADWVKARLRWARDATLAQGYTPPGSLDSALPKLGDAQSQRPACFLLEALAAATPSAKAPTELLARGGAHRWPVLFDASELARKLTAELPPVGDKPEENPEPLPAELFERLGAGDDAWQAALRGPLANALEDAAVATWLEGDEAEARALLDFAVAARAGEHGSALATELLRVQVAVAATQSMQAAARRSAAAQGADAGE